MNLILITYEYLNNIKYSIKKRTYLFYCQLVELYLYKHFNFDIENISNEFINKIVSNNLTNYSNSTINLIIGLLKRVLTFAYNKKYIPYPIILKCRTQKKIYKSIQTLQKLEWQKLENYILTNKKFYHYGILISLYTGLRIGELLALKWNAINFKNKTMKITATICDISYENQIYHIEDTPKSQSSLREIPLTSEMITLLKELKEFQKNNSEYVVSRASGKQIMVRSYQDSFTRLLKRLNIQHYGFHSLRHTFATNCYKLGMDIKTLSELLGHSSVEVTLKIYVHTDIDTKRNALSLISKKIRKNNCQQNF